MQLITSLVLVALAGVAAGSIASYSYYHDLLRPLAHLISPWILFAAVVSARRSAVHAMLGSVAGLVCGVLAFFVGKQVMYSIRYSGFPYEINIHVVALWCILAIVGGAALGLAFHRMGGRGWIAATATAGAGGLVLADYYRRTAHDMSGSIVPIIFTTIALGVMLSLAELSAAQLGRILTLLVPLTLLGYVLVSAPDILEDFLFQVR
jgi:hypothetical protein